MYIGDKSNCSIPERLSDPNVGKFTVLQNVLRFIRIDCTFKIVMANLTCSVSLYQHILEFCFTAMSLFFPQMNLV